MSAFLLQTCCFVLLGSVHGGSPRPDASCMILWILCTLPVKSLDLSSGSPRPVGECDGPLGPLHSQLHWLNMAFHYIV